VSSLHLGRDKSDHQSNGDEASSCYQDARPSRHQASAGHGLQGEQSPIIGHPAKAAELSYHVVLDIATTVGRSLST
jgi:hypothetical protein